MSNIFYLALHARFTFFRLVKNIRLFKESLLLYMSSRFSKFLYKQFSLGYCYHCVMTKFEKTLRAR